MENNLKIGDVVYIKDVCYIGEVVDIDNSGWPLVKYFCPYMTEVVYNSFSIDELVKLNNTQTIIKQVTVSDRCD